MFQRDVERDEHRVVIGQGGMVALKAERGWLIDSEQPITIRRDLLPPSQCCVSSIFKIAPTA
jgi:hypothetical protein